jgi:hypothetical protein
MKRLYQLAALVLLASPAVAFAQSCTTINAIPTIISAPGKYCLAKDFTVNMASNYGIAIAASDVTVDCDGHTLKNTNTNAGNNTSGIKAIGRNNIVVENCRVIGAWANGIDLEQNNTLANKNYYINVRNNYVAGPFWHGIRVWGSAVEVRGNQVYDIGGRPNTYAAGIRVGGSSVTTRQQSVRDNVVVGTTSPYSNAYGIFSDGSLSSAFLDNGVVATQAKAGFAAYGLYVIGQFNRISDNHVTGVGADGEVGIWSTDDSTSCFDNYLRTIGWTSNCDATMGNY